MTTYNTGNPIGSSAAKDLYDNAENLDVAINSQTAGEWTDRLGNARQTWKGIEDKAEIDIAASAASASAAAAGYRDETLAARNDAQAAASAIGPVKFYDTRAQAFGDIGGLASGDLIEVSQDETRAGARTRYKVQAGALVFVVNLDQLRLDLSGEDGVRSVGNAVDTRDLVAPTGAGMVGYLPAGVGAVPLTAQQKLREVVSVHDFYVAAEPDSTGMFQRAMDAVGDAGGGCVEVVNPGVYYMHNVKVRDNVLLRARAWGAVTLKVTAGYDEGILYNPRQAESVPLNFFGLENLIIDGNVSNQPRAVAASAVAINGVQYFYAKNVIFQDSSGYGLGLQAHLGHPTIQGPQKDIYLESCYFLRNGLGPTSVADTYDGLDIKDGDRIMLVNCHAFDNNDRGINIRGRDVTLVGCVALRNGFNSPQGLTAGIEVVGNIDANNAIGTTLTIIGGSSNSNAGAGYSFTNGAFASLKPVLLNVQGIYARGNGTHGLEIPGTSDMVEFLGSNIYVSGNTLHGISTAATVKSVGINGLISRNNGASGIYVAGLKSRLANLHISENARYGIEEAASATRTIVDGASSIINNALGNFLWNANGRRTIGRGVVDFDVGGGDIIASAGTITLPEGGDVFYITGTTTINSIAPSRRGRVVYLQFVGAMTLTNSASLRLNGGANMTTANRQVVPFTYDGSAWYQAADRSANV